jgi:micrococcal nuclease
MLLLAPVEPAFSRDNHLTSAATLRDGKVRWIQDGDTIEVAGIGTVRLLGIDAPEHLASPRDAFYKRQGVSSATLRRIHREGRLFLINLLKGKTVSLEYELEDRDRHGRLLAYVFLPDNRLVNLILIEKGYAAVYRRFDFRRKKDFLEAENRARKAGRGIWLGDHRSKRSKVHKKHKSPTVHPPDLVSEKIWRQHFPIMTRFRPACLAL